MNLTDGILIGTIRKLQSGTAPRISLYMETVLSGKSRQSGISDELKDFWNG